MTISEFPDVKKAIVQNNATYLKNNYIVLDPFKIASDYGIKYHFVPTTRPYAFTAPNPITNKPEIYISENVTPLSKKILCYHELGHIFCESQNDAHLFTGKIDHESEFLANFFVLQFLPELLEHKNVMGSTDIRAINKYMTFCIKRVDESSSTSIFDIIDINDDFWTIDEISFS